MKIVLFLNLVWILAGCSASPTQMQPTTQLLIRSSLYEQNWTWQSDRGDQMRLSQLKGRPLVVAMFFTTCSGTCGVTVNHLRQIESSLSPEQRKRVGFVLVTFDSQNDTAVQLARYRAERNLPPDWNVLRGSPQATRELAEALGVRFAPDSARHILHEAQVTVVDREGRIVRRVKGTNGDMDLALVALKADQNSDLLEPEPLTPATDGEKPACCCGGK